MSKILIIGQALPAKEQKLPYDSTLLYDMLSEIGIDKNSAQEVFIFDALSDKFLGKSKSGGHSIPKSKDIEEHFPSLYNKASVYKKVICFGRKSVKEWARGDFYSITPSRFGEDITILSLPHPSRRNYVLLKNNWEQIIRLLSEFVNK